MKDIASEDLQHFIDPFIVAPGKSISLRKDFDPSFKSNYVRKSEARSRLQEGIHRLATLQDSFYAQNTYGLLIVLQAMDAAGKDSVIKHVMSGLNPQGCQVWSFKQPSAEDLDHDYLGGQPERCRAAGPSAFSTARTMRKSSSYVCTANCSNANGCRRAS
jgi:polyphosphate kinase 2 (PPK2 family)